MLEDVQDLFSGGFEHAHHQSQLPNGPSYVRLLMFSFSLHGARADTRKLTFS